LFDPCFVYDYYRGTLLPGQAFSPDKPLSKEYQQMNQAKPGGTIRIRHRKPLLMSMTALFWFAMYTYPSLLIPYLDELGASLTLSGIIVGSYGLTQTLVRIPFGILSDRLRNKRLFIMIGMVFSLISALGLFLFENVYLILVFRAMTGLAAATWVHISTLYLTYLPPEKSSHATGHLNFMSNMGSVTAIVLGGFLAQAFGWRYAFLAAAIGAGVGLLVSLTLTEDQIKVSPGNPFSLRDALLIGRDRLLFWTSILALLSQLSTFATMQGFVPQYASILGANQSQIGLIFAFSVLPRAIASLIGGSLLARFFRLRTLIAVGFLMTAGVSCCLPLIHTLPLLFFSQIIAGIGLGLQFTLIMALCTQTIPGEKKASAMGFFQAVYGIGMIIGPVLVGTMADLFSLGTGFIIVGIVTFMTAVLSFFVLKDF
jgi:MFS family permease